MLKGYRAQDFAPGGIYLRRKGWELVEVAEEGGRLPGGEDVRYYRLPLLLVLLLGPFAGLAFILFLPLAVPVVAINALAKAINARLFPESDLRHQPRGSRPAV